MRLVFDNEKTSQERVVLRHEEIEIYNASYYETQLVRAIESLLAPFGWDHTSIRQEFAKTHEPELIDFQ